MTLPFKLGSNGAEITAWQQWFGRYAKSYAPPVDGYFGNADRDATRILQTKLGVPVTGEYDATTAARAGFPKGTPPAVAYRPIWIFSAPGSGAPWNVGPSFDLGERCREVLHINHQPIGYPIGGYLGFMGGDPTYSYNDICEFLYQEWRRLLWANPDVLAAMEARRKDRSARVAVEIWGTAYSQSADAMRRAAKRLFGPGGEFELIQDRLNGFVLFGDPGTPGTGISGLAYDPWLERLVSDINYLNDFYAIAPDKIRRAMFGIIVEADMELPFFVHVLRLAARIIPDWLTFLPIGSIFGGGPFGPLAQQTIGMLAGVGGNTLFGQLFGMAGGGGDQAVDDQLYNLLKPTGVLASIPDMVGLIAALPGLQAHGGYQFDPVMMQRAYDVIANFRR